MATAELLHYMHEWQAGRRDGLTPEVAAASLRRRSFRPHRIVPRLYVGSQPDVRDTWALYTRLLPERLALVVCACARGAARLELRQTAHGLRGSRALAQCAWPALAARVAGPQLSDWLSAALQHRSFDITTAEGQSDRDCSKGKGVVFLRLCLPWEDDPRCLLREGLDVAVALMRAAVDGLGMAVVAHCAAGKSRSVTIACAFLLQCWCDEAFALALEKVGDDGVALEVARAVVDFVREVRLCACPNPGFMLQLAEYAEELLSRGK